MSRTKHTTLPAALDAELYELVREIPAGSVATYGQLARLLGRPNHARLVGRLLGRAPSDIPCHRVVGTNGSLTGYAGGIHKKGQLLELERADMRRFFLPEKGTAL